MAPDLFNPFGKHSQQLDDSHLQPGPDIRDEQHARRAVGNNPGASRGERGVICDVFSESHTYAVQTERGRILPNVIRLLQDPGDVRLLPVGTCVAISHAFGQPVIMGVLVNADRQPDPSAQSLTGVTNTDTLGQEGDIDARPKGAPTDLGPGDWAQLSPDGNGFTALAGGVNAMRSNDYSQVRTHALRDLVEIISRNFIHHTDMGTSEFKNDGGRNSWTFRGGSDSGTESGSDQENWTIRIDLGAEGGLFNFVLSKPNGGTVFKLFVDNNGKVELYGAEGLNLLSGGKHTEKHLTDHVTEIKGSDTQTVNGNRVTSIQGSNTTSTSLNESNTAGNDRATTTVRNEVVSVGGNREVNVVGGDPLTAKPGNVALRYTINNGSVETLIGSPTAGASPAALAGYTLKAFLGDLLFMVVTKGNITFDTLAGNVTMKTALGMANLDGTTVHLGPIKDSLRNPLVLGTEYVKAFTTYLSTCNGILSGASSPDPSGATLVAVAKGLTAANQTLLSNLALTLSTLSFTA